MEPETIMVRLRCSIQRALLGEVDDRMVAVTCGIVGSTIRIRSYVDGPVTPEDLERIQVVSTEVITDFINDGFTIEEECLSLQSATAKPAVFDFWAFYRAPKETVRGVKKQELQEESQD